MRGSQGPGGQRRKLDRPAARGRRARGGCRAGGRRAGGSRAEGGRRAPGWLAAAGRRRAERSRRGGGFAAGGQPEQQHPSERSGPRRRSLSEPSCPDLDRFSHLSVTDRCEIAVQISY